MSRTNATDAGSPEIDAPVAQTTARGASPRSLRATKTASAAGVFGPTQGAPERREALAAFLRSLAKRVEQDPAFARTLLAVYAESSTETPRVGRPPAATGPDARASASRRDLDAVPALDPFTLLREQGESTLHTRLGALDIASLRAILRAHRLDPARIASRWTSRDRVVDLIVEQVRARTRVGRAFERV